MAKIGHAYMAAEQQSEVVNDQIGISYTSIAQPWPVLAAHFSGERIAWAKPSSAT